MASHKKTNAVRIAESKGVSFEIVEYEVDEEDLSAEKASAKTGIPEERMFKTLVARGDKSGVIMACVPAGKELSLKALAAASGNKKTELVHLKEVLGLTGYMRGGCSPIGTKKKYPVFIDESAMAFDFIAVNAGARGVLFKMAPGDLAALADGKTAPLVH